MDIFGSAGAFGKDLFDLRRPYTHTKVHFGNEHYRIEYCEDPLPYGTTLTHLLRYDASDYLRDVEKLKSALADKDAQAVADSFLQVIDGFMQLPFYRVYVKDYLALEPAMLPMFMATPDRLRMAEDVLADDGTILDKYFWAAEDVQMIQERYSWFLDELFENQEPEKKKGQRKLPLAAQVVNQLLEPYVSGRSLGADSEVDAPQINVQYTIYEPLTGGDAEVVEKMYFDRLADFVYVEFMKGIQKGYIPKRCRNCGKWFLQTPGPTFSYCSEIAPGETGKTCRDIGATASFSEKIKNNDGWKIHQRAYKKYYARVLKKTMTKAEFEAWARDAERLRDDALKKYEQAGETAREQIVAELKRELNKL